MKHLSAIICVLLTLMFSVGSASCSKNEEVLPEISEGNDDDNNNEESPMSNKLQITAGLTTFSVTLEDNATVKAFKALLPLSVNMPDMNRNEKYFYLPENLPTTSSRPGIIHSGDLMLYGTNCLVLFYETFSSSYSYTRLGRVDNPSELAPALGIGDVTVTFEITNN